MSEHEEKLQLTAEELREFVALRQQEGEISLTVQNFHLRKQIAQLKVEKRLGIELAAAHLDLDTGLITPKEAS